MPFIEALWELSLEASPWLLLGLLLAGLVRALLPTAAVVRYLGGRGLFPIVAGALAGAPIPICSCGVIPLAVALRRQGASRGATVSFLVSTPETGVDSVAVTYALLGPFMAVVRPVAAVTIALFTGLLAMLVPERAPIRSDHQADSDACCGDGEKADACCDTASEADGCRDSAPEAAGCCDTGSNCCDSDAADAVNQPSLAQRLRSGLRYAMSDLFDDLAGWLVAGLIVAAAVAAFVSPSAMEAWGSGFVAKLAMLFVGVPMYVCASASTPLAAAMLVAGMSPGTVLVFLLAGPGTNMATLGLVRREMGYPTLGAYLLGLCGGALALGVATDALARAWQIDTLAQVDAAGELVPAWLAITCLAVLLAVGLWRAGARLNR